MGFGAGLDRSRTQEMTVKIQSLTINLRMFILLFIAFIACQKLKSEYQQNKQSGMDINLKPKFRSPILKEESLKRNFTEGSILLGNG